MDEFGVLVESIGFKAQGQSAPLAKLKSQPKQPNYHNGFPQNIAPPSKPLNNDPFFVDDLDGIFRSNTNNITKNSQNSHDFFGGNDVFGGPFSNSKPSGAAGGIGLDDLFVGNSSSKGSTTLYDDLLGTMSKNDDIFGLNSNNSRMNLEKNGNGFDDLIPGFGQSNKGANSATGRSPSNLGSPSAEDPLSVFESFVSHKNTSSWPFSETSEQSAGKSSSSIDELEDFAMGRSQSNANERSDVKISKEAMTRVQEKLRNMKDFGDKQNAVPDGKIKVPFPNKDVRKSRGTPETKVKKTSPQTSHSTKKAPSSSNYFDDFSFFGEPAPSAVEFQEIDGEPEERRRARLNTHMKTKERMAKALEEKNQRDLQAQREQEEKRRLAETLDADIKQWAAGKEGNLRALLSSLQYVLWPECGWQPVSLTDLITSTSVKKVYLKATLYVHPDKVQQKGAKQKYIAERVFDVLKEAWNKFNAEELR